MATSAIEENNPDVANANATRAPAGFVRDPFDWALLLSVVCLAPLVAYMLIDHWQRTDLWFSGGLVGVTAILIPVYARLSTHDSRGRSIATAVLFCLAGALAVLAAMILSPWLAVGSLVACLVGWQIERCGETHWAYAAGRVVPLALLLLLPLSDTTDYARTLEESAAVSSGALLDLFGVPNLVQGGVVEVRDGVIGASAVCRWICNPYLLLSLVVVYQVLRQSSTLSAALLILTIPLWCWLGSVIYLTVGCYVQEVYAKTLFGNTRGLIFQAGELLVMFLFVWMAQKSVRTIILPFVAFSGTGAELHKAFNRVVYWPEKDPLRKRRSAESEAAAKYRTSFSRTKLGFSLLGIASIAILISGGLNFAAVASGILSERVAPVERMSVGDGVVAESALPADFGGMIRQDFRERRDPNKPFDEHYEATWLYRRGLLTAELTLRPAHRGFFPLEERYLSPSSKRGEPREGATVETIELSGILVDEIILLDEAFGRSYLCYATVGRAGQTPLRTLASGSALGRKQLADSLTLQPSVATVSLFIQGTPRLNEQQREELRQLLIAATVDLSVNLRDAGRLPGTDQPASD
ncbi:MAG TPA: hypothetical protein DDW52_09630 [Planctomycetaceae bacterium]|nr:hypothetical protein [Planctomycetaceae bacterium]